MRRIMVLNPKGGCGKSTIATNLASYYACKGSATYLVDFDIQGSSMDWLDARPETTPAIQGVLADDKEFLIPHGNGVMIMDAPAGIHGKRLKQYVKRAQTLIIPVLPSPMDMRATARFVEELLLVGRVSRDKTRIAVVANRVREYTRIYHSLERFLDSLSIPFLTSLRDTQNYIRAAQQGLGIFELAPHEVKHDIEQWQPMLDWLASSASMPGNK
jgi:chromosome partitioning protein